MKKIVATTSLPVDRLTATDCNTAARANSQVAYKNDWRHCLIQTTSHTDMQILDT